MRYDTPIYFQIIKSGEYDIDTGDYELDQIQEEKRYANVTDAGEETMRLVYGIIKQDSRVIRLQNPYKKAFDQIRIDKKLYHVDLTRSTLRGKNVFIVSEVQG